MNIIAQAASGSISLLRLSGPDALKIASALLSDKNAAKLAQNPRMAILAKLQFSERIDTALVIYFKAPASFTGEDVVEFHLHGGYLIAEQLVSALLQLGARAAQPGEFSKRACLNGKMSVKDALLINELINAKSENARRIISKNIDGAFKSLIESCQDDLVLTLAHIETAIDYADDDLPADITQRVFVQLAQNAEQMAAIAERSRQKRALIEGFSLAIIGEPNVGKSSLLNALLNTERAIVSAIAGTTRDSVEEQLNFEGFLLRLIDTAGIRAKASDEIEQIGINRSLKMMENADILVFLADASSELSASAKELLNSCRKSNKPLFVVLNKCDLPLANELANEPNVLKISAAKGQISELKSALLEHFRSFNDEEMILSNAALINSFASAANHIQTALQNACELELCAYHLNRALETLSIFGKEHSADAVFDAMFSNFCLGK